MQKKMIYYNCQTEDSMKNTFKNAAEAKKYFNSLYGECSEYQTERYETAFNKFKSIFGKSEAHIASSSGRVEIVGNHTDHNGGKVISCAISLDTLAFFLPTDNGIIRIVSEGYRDIVVDTAKELKCVKGTSHALVCGIVDWLNKNGYKVGGFNAYFTSNVCGGAGISSSASFEVLIAEILNFLYNDEKLDEGQKAIAAQYSENVYFGKPCGLLDQSAISFGGLKKLDFADKSKIKVTSIDNDLHDYTLILVNTGGSHANLTDEYAAVPAEMFSVAKAMGKDRLIDISEETFYEKLPSITDKVSDRAICRAIHFYQENKRVDSAAESLDNGDYDGFLKAINESGISSLWKLQNCYVAGSKEQLIPKAIAITGNFLCGGANRVHGGGFAGCILCIVKNDAVNDFIEKTSSFYLKENIIKLHVRKVGTIVL